MSANGFGYRIENILVLFKNIREDVENIDFEEFQSDRRRQDAVLFNLTKISWLLSRVKERFPREFSALPEKKMKRLMKLGSLVQSYGNDAPNTWKIITEELTEYELMLVVLNG